MVERILQDSFQAIPSLSVSILRYFNPIGAHPSGRIGEDPTGIPNNLLPYVSRVAAGKLEELQVFGDDYDTHDGTGVRDYIHVVDLAKAHIAALEELLNDSTSICKTYNLGTGRGYSVLDVVKAFEEVSGQEVPYQITARRSGDVGKTFADPTKANRQLGWSAQKSLKEMCQDMWNWQQQNQNGYSN
jgi:UDP-glucose 4-epimerase